MDLTKLTWTCHVCHDERPDALIGVFKRVHPIANAGGATMQENIRYCIDRPECVEGAKTYTHLKSKSEPDVVLPDQNLLNGALGLFEAAHKMILEYINALGPNHPVRRGRLSEVVICNESTMGQLRSYRPEPRSNIS